MTTSPPAFTLHYAEWYDERVELEMTDKGYLSGMTVELEDGSRYELYFYDPVRLGQDLAADQPYGMPCVAEVNMVVVPEVTPAAIRAAVAYLVEAGYFRKIKPLTADARP